MPAEGASSIRVDASAAECLVFTYREGLLSPVAHDLMLRVTRFELAWDGATLTAQFDAGSLRVVQAMKRGKPSPGSLDREDEAEIEEEIASEVLHTRRHPKIGFRSTEVARHGDGFRVEGELTLHGVTHPVSAHVTRRGDRFVTEVRLDQRDYGIRPYAAMLGTLKVKPEVRVRLSVPAAAVPEDPLPTPGG